MGGLGRQSDIALDSGKHSLLEQFLGHNFNVSVGVYCAVSY